MDKRLLADQIIESGVLFEGPWSLERVGHEQWVFRGTKESLPAMFHYLEKVEYPESGKCEIQLTSDMRLMLHEHVEHVQLRIYDKERIEALLSRDTRRLNVTPESIEKVKAWVGEATKSGVDQLSYLTDTLAVFGQEA